ncbi:unnamed protein product, partial [Sphenostylis stenocarpa]
IGGFFGPKNNVSRPEGMRPPSGRTRPPSRLTPGTRPLSRLSRRRSCRLKKAETAFWIIQTAVSTSA